MKSEIKKEKLRTDITETAIAAIKSAGFDHVSMEEIARLAGITKRTLYKYFPVKEAIVEEYIIRAIRHKNEDRKKTLQVLTDFEKRVIYYLTELVRGVSRERELFEKYLAYLMQQMVSGKPNRNRNGSGVTEPLMLIIEEARDQGAIRDDIPAFWVIDFFLFSFVEASKQLYRNPDAFDLEETVKMAAELFIKGVSA